MCTKLSQVGALANRLSKYGIGSKALRVGYDVVKGYPRAQFQELRIRYLDDETSTTLRSHRKIDYIGYKRNIMTRTLRTEGSGIKLMTVQ